MLSLGDNLSRAVRAAIVLPARESAPIHRAAPAGAGLRGAAAHCGRRGSAGSGTCGEGGAAGGARGARGGADARCQRGCAAAWRRARQRGRSACAAVGTSPPAPARSRQQQGGGAWHRRRRERRRGGRAAAAAAAALRRLQRAALAGEPAAGAPSGAGTTRATTRRCCARSPRRSRLPRRTAPHGKIGGLKKTARFAAASGPVPERVGEPPAPIVRKHDGAKDADGLAEGHGKATYANGDVYEGEWRGDVRGSSPRRRSPTASTTRDSGGRTSAMARGWRSTPPATRTTASGALASARVRGARSTPRKMATRASGRRTRSRASARSGRLMWEVYEEMAHRRAYDGRGTYLYASSDIYEGEYRGGKRDGRGVYMYAGGDVYEGEYKAGKMEGRGTVPALADGTAEVGRYFAGADVGEGARWSADRKTAYRLRGGRVEEEITLEEAAKIAGNLGLAVPQKNEDFEDIADAVKDNDTKGESGGAKSSKRPRTSMAAGAV